MATVLHTFRGRARQSSGEPVLFGTTHEGWGSLSWGAWWASVRQAATGLREMGVASGQRVAVWSRVGPAWAVTMPAIRATGAIPLVIPCTLHGQELEDALGHAATVVVDDVDRLEAVLKLREAGRIGLEHVVTLPRLPLFGERVLHLERLIDAAAHVVPLELDPDLQRDSDAIWVWRDRVWHPISFAEFETLALPSIKVDSTLWLSGSDDTGVLLATIFGLAENKGTCAWFAADGADFAPRIEQGGPTHVVLDSEGWSRLHRSLSPEAAPGWLSGLQSRWLGWNRKRILRRASCYSTEVASEELASLGVRPLGLS